MNAEKTEDVQFLIEHLQKHPDSILFARLADVYLKMGRVEEAIQLCESGIKKYPYYVTGHLILGKCYMANKMFDEAEKEFKRVLLFDPRHLAAHKLYGDLMLEMGWEKTCEMSYKKILQIDPLDQVARSRVGEYVLQGEDRQETPYPRTATPNADVELEAMSPVSETPDEEELLFTEGEPVLEEKTGGLTEPPAPDIDAQKEEEFSSILDDIFKDEVVQEETETRSAVSPTPEAVESDLIEQLQMGAEPYVAEPEKHEPEPTTEEPFADLEDLTSQPYSPEPALPTQEASPPPEPTPAPTPTPPRKKPTREKIVTPTLGEIYAAQGQYAKAIEVFERLLAKHPDNPSYAQKIEMLKQKLEEAKNASKPKN